MPVSILHCTQADEDKIDQVVEVPEIGSAANLCRDEEGGFYVLVTPLMADAPLEDDKSFRVPVSGNTLDLLGSSDPLPPFCMWCTEVPSEPLRPG